MKEYPQIRFQIPEGATELLLVRHGESRALSADYPFPLAADGQGDPELAEHGQQQADKLGQYLAGQSIDAVYVTSLQRTQQTAAPLCERLGITPVVEADLREVFLGEWEAGRYRERVLAKDPLFSRAKKEQRWDIIPGAETNQAIEDRVGPALERIVSRHPNQRVVTVVHGGIIGYILARATGSRLFAFGSADNGSISKLVIHGKRQHIRSFNDTAHLS